MMVSMKKDFIRWHAKKSQLNDIVSRPSFHEQEVWFCYLGLNIGFEQDGIGDDYLRPVIIVRQFNHDIFWAIPVTRTEKRSMHYFEFSFREGTTSFAVISQIRLIDAKRLAYKIGIMSDADFTMLKQKIKDFCLDR